MNSTKLKYIEFYIKNNLKPIAVYPKSKIPIGKNWNKNWNKNKILNSFHKNAEINIGILLGDIIDVEADTEESNLLLNEMIEKIPHPCYMSSRSYHHFFLTPDPNLTALKVSGIEFRGYKHHSVVPPSSHENNIEYKWIETSFPPPKLPQKLLDFYFQHKKHNNKIIKIKPGIKPEHTTTICNKCQRKIYIHKKRLTLEVQAFLKLGSIWTCNNCRKIDLRPIVKKLKRKTKIIL